MKLLISKREAARQLGIDRGTTLEALIRDGRLRTVTIGERQRIPASELVRLCSSMDVLPEPRRRAATVVAKQQTTKADLRAEMKRQGLL